MNRRGFLQTAIAAAAAAAFPPLAKVEAASNSGLTKEAVAACGQLIKEAATVQPRMFYWICHSRITPEDLATMYPPRVDENGLTNFDRDFIEAEYGHLDGIRIVE